MKHKPNENGRLESYRSCLMNIMAKYFKLRVTKISKKSLNQ